MTRGGMPALGTWVATDATTLTIFKSLSFDVDRIRESSFSSDNLWVGNTASEAAAATCRRTARLRVAL